MARSPKDSMKYNPLMLGLDLTAVSAAAAIAAGYQSMAPTGQWYGRTFTGLPRGSRQIALTYDDGPNDPHTLRLLEVLARDDVRATFFLIGRYVQQRPDIAREIFQAGHVVGNHTFTHPLLIFKSETEIRRELSQCRAALQDAIGQHSNSFVLRSEDAAPRCCAWRGNWASSPSCGMSPATTGTRRLLR